MPAQGWGVWSPTPPPGHRLEASECVPVQMLLDGLILGSPHAEGPHQAVVGELSVNRNQCSFSSPNFPGEHCRPLCFLPDLHTQPSPPPSSWGQSRVAELAGSRVDTAALRTILVAMDDAQRSPESEPSSGVCPPGQWSCPQIIPVLERLFPKNGNSSGGGHAS